MSKSEGSARTRRLVYWALLVVVALVLVVAVIACLVFSFVEVSAIKSVIKSLQQHTQQTNVTSMKRGDTFASMFQSLNMLLGGLHHFSQNLHFFVPVITFSPFLLCK